MKLLLVLMTAAAVGAQTPPPNPAAGRGPAPGFGFGPPAVRSPEVSAGGKVTFRLRAPNAREVQVRGITQQAIPMVKDAEGIWSATTPPLPPDLYAYSFVVDGLAMLDPANTRIRPSYRRVGQSAVLVPGDMPWTPLPDAACGTVSHHFFHSAVADDERDFFVYTPPNYDSERKQPYPVLYLLHGLGDEANAWTEVGAANVTLDTLIAQGKAVPMIVVNPLGYGTANGPADIDAQGMYPAFVRILTGEIMPRVEKEYNASTKPAGHALAGLSMGGGEAVFGGLNHLEKFAWIGSFSGAFNNWWETRPNVGGNVATAAPERGAGRNPLLLVENRLPALFPALDAKANAKIKLLWIACGTADVLIGVNRQFHNYLDSRGVKSTYTEIPDVGHVWPLWRRNLAEFVPLLFK